MRREGGKEGEGGRKGGSEGGREGERKGGREVKREGGKGGREGERKGGREVERKGGREVERKGGREVEREGGKGGREGERKGGEKGREQIILAVQAYHLQVSISVRSNTMATQHPRNAHRNLTHVLAKTSNSLGLGQTFLSLLTTTTRHSQTL